MLKHRLLFAVAAIALAFNASAGIHTEYIQSGDLGYNVTYDDNGPVSAQVYRYAGENWYGLNIVIPDEITVDNQSCPVISIAREAFQTKNIASLSIGRNVEWIGEYAFNNCSLDELTLPPNVKDVYYKSLPECKRLIIEDGNKTLSFLKTGGSGDAWSWNLGRVTSLYMGRNINGYISHAFFSGITDLTIGASVTEIYNGLFDNAKHLQLVTLPAGLEKIGDNAFSNTEFTVLEIPPLVTSIGEYAFCNTKVNSIRFNGLDSSPKGLSVGRAAFYLTSITDVYIDRNIGSGYYTEVGNVFTSSQETLRNVEMGDNVTSLDYRLFEGCSHLDNVVVGKNVRQIESACFMNCTGLSSITLPDCLESIGGDAFANCSALTGIVLPESLSECSSNAFMNCTSLVSINIPDNLETIEREVFLGCTSLRNVSFGSGLKSIDNSAFAGCSSLGRVVLPEGFEMLSTDCFKDCSQLTRVEFPASFKTFFGGMEFDGCNSLAEVVCYGTVPARPSYGTSDLPFDSRTYSSAALRVPVEAIDAYKTSTAWGPFFDINAVDKVEATGNDLRIINGNIVSASGDDFYIEVYTTGGITLYKGNVSASPTLSKGVYVIKSDTVRKYTVM